MGVEFWLQELWWSHAQQRLVERICFPRWIRGDRCSHEEKVQR